MAFFRSIWIRIQTVRIVQIWTRVQICTRVKENPGVGRSPKRGHTFAIVQTCPEEARR